MPERTVTDIRPLGCGDGATATRSQRPLRRVLRRDTPRAPRPRGRRRRRRARHQPLLQRCRLGGSLPRISARLGDTCAPTARRSSRSPRPEEQAVTTSRDRVAITSSIHPDPDTHIEVVTYGEGGDSMACCDS